MTGPTPAHEEAARAALSAAGETSGWADRLVVESGTSTVMFLVGGAAVRVARDRRSSARLLRSQHLVDVLPDLPFAVPRSLGAPVEHAGYTAVATRRLPGAAHAPHTGDPVRLRRLLAAIRTIDPGPLRAHLATPRSFYGGEEGAAILLHRVVPLMPAELRHEARRAIAALADLPPPTHGLVHGDLGGHNVLWSDGQVVGVLDWELACEDDPAVDVAALLDWHGREAVRPATEPDTFERAVVIARTHAMQAVAHAVIHAHDKRTVAAVVARAASTLRR